MKELPIKNAFLIALLIAVLGRLESYYTIFTFEVLCKLKSCAKIK